VAPGRRHTDPADLPAELTMYAMRNLDALRRNASVHGPHVGAYAAALLEHPLPWTNMRQQEFDTATAGQAVLVHMPRPAGQGLR
jgi:hypothetical protein